MLLGFFQGEVVPHPNQPTNGADIAQVQDLYDATEWSTRWVWPFELYAPVFEAAKANGSPLVALNPATEVEMIFIVWFVGLVGLVGWFVWLVCWLLLLLLLLLWFKTAFSSLSHIFFKDFIKCQVRRKLPLEGLQALTPEDRGL